MMADPHGLPQLGGDLFLTDGGIETTLIFRDGFDLPHVAAFDLLKHEAGREPLRRYYAAYTAVAARSGVGFVLEAATWRASEDWGSKLGYSTTALGRANHEAIALLRELRDLAPAAGAPMVVSGRMGPRGDGYVADATMSADEAERYHARQAATLRQAGADMVTALTLNASAEAIGLARAVRAADLPVVISFTVETDGRLPSGQALGEAVDEVDASTARGPAYFMINCAHPTHLAGALAAGGSWRERIRGLRANASTLSHAELNEATELDDGHPEELGREYRELLARLSALNVLGGCCGTDHRHIEAICRACLPSFRRAGAGPDRSAERSAEA